MKLNTYLAYTKCVYTKEQAVALAQKHQEADAYIRGSYGQGTHGTPEYKGCAVGCMANGKHNDFIELYNIDPRIAWVADTLFENISGNAYKTWTLELFSAIPVGADTTKIYAAFMAKVLRRANKHDKLSLCEKVATLHDLLGNGVYVKKDWDSAAAADAAYDAAAADVAAAVSARAAADAAYDAADAVAYAADAAYDAYDAEYDQQRIDLLDACKQFEWAV